MLPFFSCEEIANRRPLALTGGQGSRLNTSVTAVVFLWSAHRWSAPSAGCRCVLSLSGAITSCRLRFALRLCVAYRRNNETGTGAKGVTLQNAASRG